MEPVSSGDISLVFSPALQIQWHVLKASLFSQSEFSACNHPAASGGPLLHPRLARLCVSSAVTPGPGPGGAVSHRTSGSSLSWLERLC